MNAIQTEVEFELPVGYVDASGTLHKAGTMRRATTADEILPMQDPRVQNNQSYLAIVLLSRVVDRIGDGALAREAILADRFSAFKKDFYAGFFGNPLGPASPERRRG